MDSSPSRAAANAVISQVAANSAVNKMSSKNLAIVFGPNMLSKRSAAFAGSATNLSTVNMSQDVVQLIIDNYDYLFAVRSSSFRFAPFLPCFRLVPFFL
jgi:hypothetical protein